jgi:hypothetical protein
MILGGILRIADALDRTHTSRVDAIDVAVTKEAITFRVKTTGAWNAERAMFETKRDMLETVAGRAAICEQMA